MLGIPSERTFEQATLWLSQREGSTKPSASSRKRRFSMPLIGLRCGPIRALRPAGELLSKACESAAVVIAPEHDRRPPIGRNVAERFQQHVEALVRGIVPTNPGEVAAAAAPLLIRDLDARRCHDGLRLRSERHDRRRLGLEEQVGGGSTEHPSLDGLANREGGRR
jgi:hypothetical protein